MVNEGSTGGQEKTTTKKTFGCKDPGVLLIMVYFLLIFMTLVVGRVVAANPAEPAASDLVEYTLGTNVGGAAGVR